jgi:anionic cell wall polymer biosynthesis LytR-Cps2A-Psr (LCP) family protein
MVEEEIEEMEEKTKDIDDIFDNSDCQVIPNVTHSKYSNIAYISASNRDIHINFLELPGIRKGNELLIDTTRIYMTYSSAQKLAAAIQEVLREAYSKGSMQEYSPEEEGQPPEKSD